MTAPATTASVAPALVSIIQAAEALGISKGKAYQLVGNGRLRTVKIGSRRLVPVGAISDLVAELEAGDHA